MCDNKINTGDAILYMTKNIITCKAINIFFKKNKFKSPESVLELKTLSFFRNSSNEYKSELALTKAVNIRYITEVNTSGAIKPKINCGMVLLFTC